MNSLPAHLLCARPCPEGEAGAGGGGGVCALRGFSVLSGRGVRRWTEGPDCKDCQSRREMWTCWEAFLEKAGCRRSLGRETRGKHHQRSDSQALLWRAPSHSPGGGFCDPPSQTGKLGPSGGAPAGITQWGTWGGVPTLCFLRCSQEEGVEPRGREAGHGWAVGVWAGWYAWPCWPEP